MTDVIRMDRAAMEALATNLQAIITAFEEADDDSETAAAATGDDKLSDAVKGFGDRWRITRGKMMDNIKNMQQMVATVVKTFGDVDEGLAGSLTQGPGESQPAAAK